MTLECKMQISEGERQKNQIKNIIIGKSSNKNFDYILEKIRIAQEIRLLSKLKHADKVD